MRRPNHASFSVFQSLERRRLLSAGDPDLTFGVGGTVHANFGFGEGFSVQAVEMDAQAGKTVLLGEVFGEKHQFGALVARLNADGSFDKSFANVGYVAYAEMRATGIVALPNGKLLLSAVKDRETVDSDYTQPVLIRLNADGSYDKSFSGDGIVELSRPASAVAIGGDGAIWVSHSGGAIELHKYTASGAVDNTFGGGTGMIGWDDYVGDIRTLTVTTDGRVIGGGYLQNQPIAADPNVVYPSGEAIVSIAGPSQFQWGLRFLPSGYTVGDLAAGQSGQIVVGSAFGKSVRPLVYSAAGTLLKKFAALQLNTNSVPWSGVSVADVGVAADGKVIVFSTASSLDDGGGAVARFNNDGTIDKTFAPGLGYRPTSAVQGDLDGDRIVVAGVNDSVLVASRYWNASGPNPVPATLVNGTLGINGTGGDDTIIIRAAPVTPGGATMLRVQWNDYYRGFAAAQVATVVVNAAAGNDAVCTAAVKVPVRLNGGTGNDTLAGGSVSDRIEGGDGNDTLVGNDGNDTLRGGIGDDTLVGDGGNDLLDGGVGADEIHGEGGTDWVDYTSRTAPLVVTLHPFASSGEAGENDTIFDCVEIVNGGAGDDVITGNVSNNTLYGNAGSDKLFGVGGNDKLYGGAGKDALTGGAGIDQLFGDAGDDLLIANDGTKDSLFGGAGIDTGSVDAIDILNSVEKKV